MSDYICVVVVDKLSDTEHKLYQAPAFSSIKPGDEVICETPEGERNGIVVDVEDVSKSNRFFEFVLNAMKATLPLPKIISIVSYKELEYESEDN